MYKISALMLLVSPKNAFGMATYVGCGVVGVGENQTHCCHTNFWRAEDLITVKTDTKKGSRFGDKTTVKTNRKN
jgi:hypothetical protein